MPKKRFAWSVTKMSDMKLQNTESVNRFVTLMKIANATVTAAIGALDSNASENATRNTTTAPNTNGRNFRRGKRLTIAP